MPELIYNDELHEYRLDGNIIPSVTQVLDAEGAIDTTFMDEFGRDRGRKVHLANKYLLEGRLDINTLDERIVPYVQASEKFIQDVDYRPQIIEKPMSHPIYKYGMTPDTIGTMAKHGDELVLIDWKTGGKLKATILQMAAYVEGLRANDIEVKHVYIIYLKDNGTYKPDPIKITRHDVGVFLAGLTWMNWKNNHLKGRK